MAKNVAELFQSDWGIAITGYASPVPEKNIHDLFACYAIYYRGEEMVRRTVYVENNTPQQVKLTYTNVVLNCFSVMLTNHSVGVCV
jgi:nicotinamide mononucleotide (NMN) deamidase PncC